MTGETRGALLVFGAALGFASLGTFAGIAYATGMTPAAFVTLRAVIGALLLAALIAAQPHRRVRISGIDGCQQAMLAAAVATNGAFNLALFSAFQLTSVAVVLAIYFTYPIMVAALALVTDGIGGLVGSWIADPVSWLTVLGAGLIGTAVAKVWVLRGLRLLGGTRTAVIMLAEPVGGVVLAAVVLGQSIVPVEALGGVLILIAALIVQRPAPGRTVE